MTWVLVVLFFGEANTGFTQRNEFPMPDQATCERAIDKGAITSKAAGGNVVAVVFCQPKKA